MKKTKIEVKTFGGFKIVCDDKSVVLGRNKASKYIQLVTRVCSAGAEGVTKEDLQSDIYSEDINIKSNLNNSMNNLLYQFRKVAEKAGIPDGKLIAFVDGRYKVDSSCDCTTDTVEFLSCINNAKSTKDADKKRKMYEKACQLYDGYLLPELDDLYWISKMAEQIHVEFEEAVDFLSKYYKENGNYKEMAAISHKAAQIDPDKEWQVIEIDAYRLMKEFQTAFAKYDEMIRYYAEELGIAPTDSMQTCYQKLQDDAFSDAKIAKADNAEEMLEVGFVDGDDGGPYECLFPEMSASYHILNRNMSRHGLTVFLMLLTIADYEGKEIKQEEKAEKRMSALRDAINETLRNSDAFCKYSRTQYLVLLTGTGVEECALVHRRMQDRLKELAGPRASLNYRIISYDDMNDNAE